MTKRKPLQDMFEVDRLLESTPVSPDDSLTVRDVARGSHPRGSSEVTREATIGFEDELFEQSTDDEALSHGPVSDPTRLRVTEVEIHPAHVRPASRSASAPLSPRYLRGLLFALVIVFGLLASLLMRVPSPSTPRATAHPSPVVVPVRAVVKAVEESAPPEVAPSSEADAPSASPAGGEAPKAEPARPEPRSSRATRRTSGTAPQRQSAPGSSSEPAPRAESFGAIEARHRRLLSRRALRSGDLRRLNVSEQTLADWDRAKAAQDSELGAHALAELQLELESSVIDREFLEYRLNRVLGKTRARAGKSPGDEQTRRWESEYFELRKALLDPSITPSSRRALELNVRIDDLEQKIDRAPSS